MILRIFILLLALSWTAIAQTSFVTVARTVSVNPTNSRVIAPTNFWRASSNDIEQALSLTQRLAAISFSGTDTNASALALAAYAAASNATSTAYGIGVVATGALPRSGGTVSNSLLVKRLLSQDLLYTEWRAFLGAFNGRAWVGLLRTSDSNVVQGLRVLADPSEGAGSEGLGGVEIGPAVTSSDEVLWGGFVRTRNFVGTSLFPGGTNVAVSLGYYPFAGGSPSVPRDALVVTTNTIVVMPGWQLIGDGAGLSNVVASGALSIGEFQAQITNYARLVEAPSAWNAAGNPGEVASGWSSGTNYWYWFDAVSSRWQRVHAEVWP